MWQNRLKGNGITVYFSRRAGCLGPRGSVTLLNKKWNTKNIFPRIGGESLSQVNHWLIHLWNPEKYSHLLKHVSMHRLNKNTLIGSLWQISIFYYFLWLLKIISVKIGKKKYIPLHFPSVILTLWISSSWHHWFFLILFKKRKTRNICVGKSEIVLHRQTWNS